MAGVVVGVKVWLPGVDVEVILGWEEGVDTSHWVVSLEKAQCGLAALRVLKRGEKGLLKALLLFQGVEFVAQAPFAAVVPDLVVAFDAAGLTSRAWLFAIALSGWLLGCARGERVLKTSKRAHF